MEQVKFTRVLDESSPQLPFEETSEFRPQLSWEARGRLLSEIEFLTLHGGKAKTVVMRGVDRGWHHTYLSELFPNHQFHLYGVNRPLHSLQRYAQRNPDRVRICQGDEVSTGGEFLLITGDVSEVSALRPVAALARFCPGWDNDTVSIPRGKIYFLPWGPPVFPSALLMCEGECVVQEFDVKVFDGAMHHFNHLTRRQHFEPLVSTPGIESALELGLPLSYDIRCEQEILAAYLSSRVGGDRIKQALVTMMRDINGVFKETLSEAYMAKLDFWEKRKAERAN